MARQVQGRRFAEPVSSGAPKQRSEASAPQDMRRSTPTQTLLETAVCWLLDVDSSVDPGRIYWGCGCAPAPPSVHDLELEKLTRKLFSLHDLNQNGVLEEAELIQLNKKIAVLHYGSGVNKAAVTERYQNLFRSEFDPAGKPVGYPIFGAYMRHVLTELDPDVQAQIMILEQFILEASLARKFFQVPSLESLLDAPFVKYLASDEDATPQAGRAPEAGAQGTDGAVAAADLDSRSMQWI